MIRFTPLDIMPRCSATGLDFRIIPEGFNAPLEFLTGCTFFIPASPAYRQAGAGRLQFVFFNDKF